MRESMQRPSGHGVGGSTQEHTMPGAAGGGVGAGATHGGATHSGVSQGGVSHSGSGITSGGITSSGGGESMTEQTAKQLPQGVQEQGRYMAEQGRQTMEQGRELAAPYIEKGKELKDTLLQKASETSSQVQHQMHAASDVACDAMRDTRGFARRHPLAILTLLSIGLMAGMGLTTLGFTLGWTGKQLFGGHSYGSPQYEAHKALDTILQSTFGSDSSWTGHHGGLGSLGGWGGATDSGALGSLSKLTGFSGQQHPQQQASSWLQGLTSQMQPQQQPSRAQDAYHYVDDTWRSVKDRMMPDTRGAGEHAGGGVSGFLGGLKERVIHPFGGGATEWQKVEQAEQRLREALHAASQRGSR